MVRLDPAFERGSLANAPQDAVTLAPAPQSARTGERLEFAMLAHDIRGALQGVFGGLAAIGADDLPEEAREQLRRIHAAAGTIQNLSDGLARMGRGAEPEEAPEGVVRIEEFLDAYRDRWAGEARANGLGFEIAAEGCLPTGLQVPPLALNRVLGNLTANSIAYAGRGTVRLELRRNGDGELVFQLTDEGPGLDEAALRRLLGPDLQDACEGEHGIGLHIVRRLGDQIGGRISVRNREHGGMIATLAFPAALCIEAATLAPAPEPRATAAGGGLAGLRVLLAEDNPTNQMVACQMLGVLKAEVVLAADGVEALERFEEGDFDIVVVDIEMPRLTGLDVIRTIRGRGDARARTPIVALTAYALREHRERILGAGANGLISKPITGIDALARGLLAHVSARPVPVARAEAEAPAAGDALPLVDATVYGALAETLGPDMMDELLEKVAADLTRARDDLGAAGAERDHEAMRAASHIVIGVAGAIGASRLQQSARRLNTAANAENDAAIAGLIPGCVAEIEAAVAFTHAERAGR